MTRWLTVLLVLIFLNGPAIGGPGVRTLTRRNIGSPQQAGHLPALIHAMPK